MKNLIKLLSIIFVFTSCGGNKETPKEDFSRRGFTEGERIYKNTCAQCHQVDGKGLNDLYPPLADSDYLLSDKKRAACIIWHGTEGPIVVNGKEYNMKMLPVDGMSVTKVTDVMNYIYNAWGHKEGQFTDEQIRVFLKDCK